MDEESVRQEPRSFNTDENDAETLDGLAAAPGKARVPESLSDEDAHCGQPRAHGMDAVVGKAGQPERVADGDVPTHADRRMGVGMITQRVRKVGNSYVVTIPREEMERRGIREGDFVGFDPVAMEMRIRLPAHLQEAYAQTWAAHEAGYRYLADR